MKRTFGIRGTGGLLALIVLLVGPIAPAAGQQPGTDEAAMAMLNSARRAYNEDRFAAAADRFREFLRVHGGHREAASAQYGVALCLLAGPEKNYKAAMEALQRVSGADSMPDRPYVLYAMGLAARGLGEQSLAEMAGKPNEAAGLRAAAAQRFEEAARSFAASGVAFAARVKAMPATTAPADQPPDLEWSARARCDADEMLLRAGKFKEAHDAATALLADPLLAAGKYRPLATYHLGYAQYALKDYPAAGRTLSQLAPFAHEQDFGPHARYLLGRSHHLTGGRAEAAAQYKAVLAGYEERKKQAQASLANPGSIRPGQRPLLEALANGPPPEYLVRASFYLAVVLGEEDRLAEALERFTALIQQHPRNVLVAEAQLRQGICRTQLKNYAEAVRALQPLVEHPQLSDQALHWLAKAQVGGADSTNPAAYEQALRTATDNFRRAAERAGAKAAAQPPDPDARIRRGDILLDLADTQLLAKQYKEAAAAYQQVLGENNNPDRAEEALQRQATAMHLAGQYRESDELCRRFHSAYPRSTLLGAVLFREAENAYMIASAAAGDPNPATGAPKPETSGLGTPREQELARLFGEAITRYQRLIRRYPEFAYVGMARQGLATAYYRLGKLPEAISNLTAIPEAERNGDLATVNYLLADCLLRTLAGEADDAVQAAQALDQAEQAAKLLEGFVAAQAKSPQAPDAFLKLGHCYQRIAAALAEPADRQKALAQARDAYDRFGQQFAKDPSRPTALFERAKCIALLGDVGSAVNELNRFQADPNLKGSPIAPLAMLRLASLLRSQGRPAEAANVLARCRGEQEPAILKDPDRADWAAVLHYEHALAVKESPRPTSPAAPGVAVPPAGPADARAMFEALIQQYPGHPEAINAAWRLAQCRREEAAGRLAAARAAVARGGKPEEIAAAAKALDDCLRDLRRTADDCASQADDLERKAPAGQPHLRMRYEAAWCYRTLADADVELTRQKIQHEAVAKAKAAMAKGAPGDPGAALRPPEVPLSAIPPPISERAACDQYERLIAASPDSPLSGGTAPLALHARVELAELHGQRGNGEAAAALLTQALEGNPPNELAEQIRLRLATALLAKGDGQAALPHALLLARKPPNSDWTAAMVSGRYLAGEAWFQQKDWPKAIEQLAPFRDQGPFQNSPDISDRALLRLGQAHAQAAQWDASRQALDTLCQRYPASRWWDQARYGVGWAHQSQNQFDAAVNVYGELVKRSVSESAAKAQFQIGVCRVEQNRPADAIAALLTVPLTYDYPEWSAAARCEAGRAYTQLNQPDEAAQCFRQAVKDAPASPWARLAAQRLAEIK